METQQIVGLVVSVMLGAGFVFFMGYATAAYRHHHARYLETVEENKRRSMANEISAAATEAAREEVRRQLADKNIP